MTVVDQRWRKNWEMRLAERRKAEAKLQRLTDRIIRQRSWEAWKAEQAAVAAGAEAGATLASSSSLSSSAAAAPTVV